MPIGAEIATEKARSAILFSRETRLQGEVLRFFLCRISPCSSHCLFSRVCYGCGWCRLGSTSLDCKILLRKRSSWKLP